MLKEQYYYKIIKAIEEVTGIKGVRHEIGGYKAEMYGLHVSVSKENTVQQGDISNLVIRIPMDMYRREEGIVELETELFKDELNIERTLDIGMVHGLLHEYGHVHDMVSEERYNKNFYKYHVIDGAYYDMELNKLISNTEDELGRELSSIESGRLYWESPHEKYANEFANKYLIEVLDRLGIVYEYIVEEVA